MNKYLMVALAFIIMIVGCNNPPNSAPGGAPISQKQSQSQLQEKVVGNTTLKPNKPIDGLEILLPDGFTRMSSDLINTKYPNENRPNVVFTDDTGAINVAINHSLNKVAPNQLKQLHVQLDSSIREAHPTAKWMFSGMWHHHGREWTQLEFQSPAQDTKIHNMMIATSAKNRMLAISFNCTDEKSEEWLPVGREIINSTIFSD